MQAKFGLRESPPDSNPRENALARARRNQSTHPSNSVQARKVQKASHFGICRKRAISAKSKPARTAEEAVDIAARYFVYELFDVTSGTIGAWYVLGKVGERQATVARAVERGWVAIRELGLGKRKLVSASLTSQGRVLARKALA